MIPSSSQKEGFKKGSNYKQLHTIGIIITYSLFSRHQQKR